MLGWKRKWNGGLGFRNLKYFYSALLAKLSWRLVTEPYCILSRVYRARYFPHSTFFDANKGTNSSISWNNIWSAKGLIEWGSKMQGGGGLRINILTDRWFPRTTTFRLLAASQASTKIRTSVELIDYDGKRWKECISSQQYGNYSSSPSW
ncbi:UNVERIFIED_CONTAM: hypothetical protein Sradi_5087500 [Sesamum radiatum]|uniref:Uncharacterized protein n=1 Tax=Sesamum radiatum TaxID=300843 RepID=A0AAW2M4A7_SESRA